MATWESQWLVARLLQREGESEPPACLNLQRPGGSSGRRPRTPRVPTPVWAIGFVAERLRDTGERATETSPEGSPNGCPTRGRTAIVRD